MLQQTQAQRASKYFESFILKFKTILSLSRARRSNLLGSWSGLGYNRRALYLKEAASIIIKNHDGKVPRDYQDLIILPGVGPYTARAILIFGYNQWHECLETNIRTLLYFHCFLQSKKTVLDSELTVVLHKLNNLAKINGYSARKWYSLLMDYGAELKAKGINLNHMNPTHKTQDTFEGSFRQIRSSIIKLLLKNSLTTSELKKIVCKKLQCKPDDVQAAMQKLVREKMVSLDGKTAKL